MTSCDFCKRLPRIVERVFVMVRRGGKRELSICWDLCPKCAGTFEDRITVFLETEYKTEGQR